MRRSIENTRLPLVPRLDEICETLDKAGTVIIRSDPGSGKSTLVPLALMDYMDREKKAAHGRILVLEGRRPAAIAIASRMADLLGEPCGERAGYSVRLERKFSPRTRIELLTEGLFIRRIQGDPGLSGVSAVILDEFHERSVYTDLALALLLDLRRMGSALKLVIMSATMDAERTASCIRSAMNNTAQTGPGSEGPEIPVIDCPGKLFPVSIEYRPLPQKRKIGLECAAALEQLLREDREHNVLVFLPGKGEIADAEAYLQSNFLDKEFDILQFHGALSPAEQRKVLSPSKTGRKRIILSTNIAETGLTVPGISLVADSGYVKLERYHLPSGMNRLSLEKTSLHSAEQRAGRAGRLMPGRCVRFWDPAEYRPPETEYELFRLDLSSLVMECLIWGVREKDALPWLDEIPSQAWEKAAAGLRELGAADHGLNPTLKGKQLSALGLDVHLGMLCLNGREGGFAPLACACAAILSARDRTAGAAGADFRSRLSMLRTKPGHPWSAGILDIAEDLLKRLGLGRMKLEWKAEDEASAGEILAPVFPRRLCLRQDSGKYRFISGREAAPPEDLSDPWLAALEADAGERSGRIYLACPVSKQRALEVLEPYISHETKIEWKGLTPKAVSLSSAGRLFLFRGQRKPAKEDLGVSFLSLLREQGTGILPWDEEKGAPRIYMERIRFFIGRKGIPENEWTEEALAADAGDWLLPFLKNLGERESGPVLDGKSLLQALKYRLGQRQAREMDAAVPEWFTLPKSRKVRISYTSAEALVSVRIQDAFGISLQPFIMGLPLSFELLSPANRPVQTTSDIAGFWAGSYKDVRKDMKGRYPKHFWPEDGGE